MTLRQKVVFLSAFTLAGVLSSIFFFDFYLTDRNFSQFEQKLIRRNTHRAVSFLQQELYHLTLFAADWSQWDDTYNFVKNPNEEYIKANLVNQTYISQKLNLIGIFDTERGVKFLHALDYWSSTELQIPELDSTNICKISPLFVHKDSTSVVTGLLRTSSGIFMIVARPIVTSQQSGPIAGTIIFGRMLDDSLQTQIAKNLALTSFGVTPISEFKSTAGIDFTPHMDLDTVLVDVSDKGVAKGNILIKDVYGIPNFVLTILLPREIKVLEAETTLYSIILFVFVFIMQVTTYFVLKRTVVKRVELLGRQVNRISEDPLNSQLTAATGSDEVTGLSMQINKMVTNLRESQVILQESDRRFRDILANIQLIGFILDKNGTINYVNKFLIELSGYTEQELIGANWFEMMVPKEFRRERMHNYFESLQTKNFVRGQRHEVLMKNGTRRLVTFNVTPLYDLDGEPFGIASLGEDITDRVNAERDAHQLAMLVEGATVGIALTDIDGNFLYINSTYSILTGYAPSELIGKSARMLKAGSAYDEIYEEMKATIARDETWTGELHRCHRDGTIYTVMTTVQPIHDEKGTVAFYGNFERDTTKERELKFQLERAQRLGTIGELTGGIAHNFNNLLTVVMGNLALAKISLHGPELIYLTEAETATSAAADLVKHLMSFSRQAHLVRKPIDANTLVSDVLSLIRNTFDRRIEVIFTPMQQKCDVFGDANQLKQVIMNICFNARDALTAVGEVPGRVLKLILEVELVEVVDKIVEAENRNGFFITISITDSGTGMTRDTQKRVFEPFFTTKETGKGTGLGLSTAFGTIRQHDGWISVYSELGLGTTFRIYLPVCSGNNEASDTLHTQLDELPRGTETILFTEDEEMVQRVGKTILEQVGYKIVTANHGRDALEKYLATPNQFDLILLDMSMPVMSGRELLQEFRNRDLHPKVVVSSGLSLTSIDQDLLKHVSGYVGKPFNRVDLLSTIRRVLDTENNYIY